MKDSSNNLSFDLAGTHKARGEPENLWRSLNDPAALQSCIKGCERAEQETPGNFILVFMLRFGPVRKKLSVSVQVIDIAPPGRYQLTAHLLERAGGTAKGAADVRLDALEGGYTDISYTANAEVSGWFALIGKRVMTHAAQRYMKRFVMKLEKWRPPG